MAIDARVIEAAAKAWLETAPDDAGAPDPVAFWAPTVEAAILAADAERAEEVKAAVDEFMKWCIRYGGHGDGTYNAEKNAARRDLYRLLNIPEGD